MTRTDEQTERAALLHFDDWAGRSAHAVVVVGETPKRWRIRVPDGVDVIRLAGRHRYLHRGDTALVPKDAVTFDEEIGPEGERPATPEQRAAAARLFDNLTPIEVL